MSKRDASAAAVLRCAGLRPVHLILNAAGPTNSGKTYQAIERLKKAGANRQPGDGPAGLFCGPLRLLALEVYEQVG